MVIWKVYSISLSFSEDTHIVTMQIYLLWNGRDDLSLWLQYLTVILCFKLFYVIFYLEHQYCRNTGWAARCPIFDPYLVLWLSSPLEKDDGLDLLVNTHLIAWARHLEEDGNKVSQSKTAAGSQGKCIWVLKVFFSLYTESSRRKWIRK